MKRIWGRALFLLTGALVSSALAPACANNDQTIYIRNVQAPPANRQNGTCLYLPDPVAPFISEGLLDVGVRDNYVAHMIVGNQLAARGDRNQNRAESNRVQLNGAVVQVTNPDDSLVNEFTSVASGFADPQVGDGSSFAILASVLIDAKTSAILAADLPNRTKTKLVIAKVKAFGTSLGGVDVESGEFKFPIRVCNGCSVSFNGADDGLTPGVPNCKKALADNAVRPCFLGQDEPTPCQLCAGRPICDDPLRP